MWVADIAFSRELLEFTKLVKFERYAEFTVAGLTGHGLGCGPPGSARITMRWAKVMTWKAWSRGWLPRPTGSWTTPASTGRSTEVTYINLPAGLNLEDDEGRNIARLADAVSPDAVIPARLVVGCRREH